MSDTDRPRRLEARFEVTEPAGEGPRPKLFIANTKFYPLMARPNKAAGAIAGGRRAPVLGLVGEWVTLGWRLLCFHRRHLVVGLRYMACGGFSGTVFRERKKGNEINRLRWEYFPG